MPVPSRPVVAVMSRAPSQRTAKTRLRRSLDTDDLEELVTSLLRDTLDAVNKVSGIDRAVIYTPATAASEFGALVPDAWLLAQRGGDLGERMHGAFLDLFAIGASGAILIGSDLPTLPSSHLQMAAAALSAHADPLVIGPAADGGYYLIGLNRPHGALFEGMRWGTQDVLAATLRTAALAELEVVALPRWYDVDTSEDLRRALRDAATLSTGLHTRRWFVNAPPEIQKRLSAGRIPGP